MLIKDLVALFNTRARIEYNKAYQEMEPEFGDLLYEYSSGPVETMDFPFEGFLRNMEEFKGSRIHQTFPDGYRFQVSNKEWDVAVDIKRANLERATMLNSPVQGLNLYLQRIAEMPKMVKDHPVELAFDMLEAGDANTYGTTFDGQNLFDTTHDYGTSAGTQNNIVTGTGVTAALIHADILSVMSRFKSFYYTQGNTGNAQKRGLNKGSIRPLIVAPVELEGVLFDLKNKSVLATGEENTLKGSFDYCTKFFTDANDWYALLRDEPVFKPFLYQVEMPTELDFPTPNDESVKEKKILTWGAYGRYNVAYGAWWKAIKVTNT